MKSVSFYTLGCKLNFSETSTIARTFRENGYQQQEFEKGTDVVVINTCSVTDNADKKCRKIVRDAKKYNPKSFVAVIGCYAQLKPKEIVDIPGVNAVLGANEKFRMLELLSEFESSLPAKVYQGDIREVEQYHTSFSSGDRTRTFLKVQDGCNYGCAFCTIPLARGKSRSDTIDNVVETAKKIVQTGAKEIVLTGVNTGDFGIHNGRRKERFADLVTELDQIEQIERIRISSIEPNLLSDEIVEIVANSRKFVPHFHIPLQSGSDEILKSMNRRYRTDLYTSRIGKIRKLMPHASIGVDVIVGFPGESEEHFLETYSYLNQLDVSYLHVFTYSERPNTPALDMDGVVPQADRASRSRMLRNLSLKKKRAFYQQHIGSEQPVLFENDIKGNYIHGFTPNYLRVKLPKSKAEVNQIKLLKLQSIDDQGIITGKEIIPELV